MLLCFGYGDSVDYDGEFVFTGFKKKMVLSNQAVAWLVVSGPSSGALYQQLILLKLYFFR